MREQHRLRAARPVTVAVAVAVAAAVAVVALVPSAACGAAPPPAHRSDTGTSVAPVERGVGAALLGELRDLLRAVAAGRRFLDGYVEPDGRVVRRDQAGDTVSEAQAYAMTVAAAIGDEATFRRVWSWTQRELRRDDGLFAWRWADGAVVDDEPAADADLFIAGALSLAADRFDDTALAAEARRTGDAILLHETTTVGGRRVLVAGPWAVAAGVVNPSYAVLPMMSRLWEDGSDAWAEVAATSRLAIDRLTATAPHLAPDWAAVTAEDRGLRFRALGTPPRSGWDAVRVPVQLAADCDPAGRRLAARTWPFHLSRDVVVAAVHDLDGTVVDPTAHAAAIVGAAGAASAAGADDSTAVLLARAAEVDAAHPSYYGAAWTALGRLWLTTPLLGGCAWR